MQRRKQKGESPQKKQRQIKIQQRSFNLFKQSLLEMKSDLLNSSASYLSTAQTDKTQPGDDVDNAVEEINLNLTLSLRERDRLLVQKIDHAMAKIENGSYGVCEGCNSALETKRLLARPFATLCVECKEEQEYKSKIYA